MAIYIEEFLYRGRAAGSAEEPAWHLVLASTGEDDFGQPTIATRTLNMAEAEAASWGLPEIIAAINAELMAEVDTKRSEVQALAQELADKDAELASLTKA